MSNSNFEVINYNFLTAPASNHLIILRSQLIVLLFNFDIDSILGDLFFKLLIKVYYTSYLSGTLQLFMYVSFNYYLVHSRFFLCFLLALCTLFLTYQDE